MASSKFWSAPDLEPKRQFKFLFILPSEHNIETYLVKSVTKPQVTIGTDTTVNYIQHTFKYPGRLAWNDIDVTLIDTVRVDDTSSRLASIIRDSGYVIPDSDEAAQYSFSKKSAVNALNTPRIQQITAGDPANGIPPQPVEEWTLWNAWVKSIDFGGTLSYDTDAIVNVTLGITYDWAEYTTVAPGNEFSYNNGGGLQRMPKG